MISTNSALIPAILMTGPELPEGMTPEAAVRLLTARPGLLPPVGGVVPILRPGLYVSSLVALQRLGVGHGGRRARMDVRVRWLDDKGDVHDDGPHRVHLAHHLRQLGGPIGSWALGWWVPLHRHGHQWRPMCHQQPRRRRT